jgi:hypothetical protein
MNVLILGPDRTGSSFLLNLVTIYMQFHEYDRPVISLYDMGSDLNKYYSDVFNSEVLSCNREYTFRQSLPEICDLLKSVDHYKNSRLTFSTMIQRQDSVADQNQLYRYLNDNFFIISTRRENLFEHVLSWCIKIQTKGGNAYNANHKFDILADVYRNKITIDQENMHKHLERYRQYLQWCDEQFDVGSYFYYEKHISNIEQYVLQLPIFNNQTQKISWKDKFDIEFNDWNKCNYLISDLSGLSQQLSAANTPLLNNQSADVSSLELAVVKSTNKIVPNLGRPDVEFLKKHSKKFVQARNNLDELVNYKILDFPLQIKLQTMIEKKLCIKNFNQCVEWYNEWVIANNFGQIYSEDTAGQSEIDELKSWHATNVLQYHQQ